MTQRRSKTERGGPLAKVPQQQSQPRQQNRPVCSLVYVSRNEELKSASSLRHCFRSTTLAEYDDAPQSQPRQPIGDVRKTKCASIFQFSK